MVICRVCGLILPPVLGASVLAQFDLSRNLYLPSLVAAAMLLVPGVPWKTASIGRLFSPSHPWGSPSHRPMFLTKCWKNIPVSTLPPFLRPLPLILS